MAELELEEQQVGVTVTPPILKAELSSQTPQVRFAEWRSNGNHFVTAFIRLPGVAFVLFSLAGALDTASKLGAWRWILRSHLPFDTLLWIVTGGFLLGGLGGPFAFFVNLIQDRLRLKRALPSESHPDDIAVAIGISRNGILIGEDVGYVRFFDGLLFFEGTETAFSFSNQEVRRLPSARLQDFIALNLGVSPLNPLRLAYHQEGQEFVLGIKPLLEFRKGERLTYSKRIAHWQQTVPEERVVNVFPPSQASPDLARSIRSSLLWPILCFELCVETLLTIFMGSTLSDSDLLVSKVLTVLLTLAVGYVGTFLPLYRAYKRYRSIPHE